MPTEDARKLFVAGLSDSITEEVLRDVFTAAGATVVSVSLPKDRTTGRARGFGFVTLSTAEEAHSARQSLDGSMQAGRAISVRPFQSEPPRRDQRTERESVGGGGGGVGVGGGGSGAAGPASGGEDRTLYVGNLPYDTSQAEVERLFSERGVSPVIRVHLPVGPDGRLRGFGFVTLGSAEAANAALTALRDVEVRGRRLMINIAHPRGERPAGGPRGPRESGGMRSEGPRWDPTMESPPAEARTEGGRRPRTAAEREEEADWERKKKKRRKGPSQPEEPKRNRGNWQKWDDWDED